MITWEKRETMTMAGPTLGRPTLILMLHFLRKVSRSSKRGLADIRVGPADITVSALLIIAYDELYGTLSKRINLVTVDR